ncbi:hypothetical protein AAFC00_007064 [Neodothiora populina]|uniref:DUF605-domain-containing protein n=1 Tax=Neodothiora populina TaxID=2781224 RepID=A0ABR3PCD0_9PEZI
MASALPAPLKIKDIVPFVTRAVQLEKYKPIISYWCYYYIVDQILAKGLHTASDECMNYTTTLMDKLEQFKTEQAGNDAITDDVAAKAYVEQFALETFQRGDTAIHTNNASRQTIDTFQAASTFFDLLNMPIWAPVDPELAAKSKYAKYHAVRIAKAIKAGDDPNASNPVAEEPAIQDPMSGLEEAAPSSSAYVPPTVESAPESKQPSRPGSVVQANPTSPPSATPMAPDAPFENMHSPSAATEASRTGSVGGGYFPSVPTFTSDDAQPTAPTAAPDTSTPADFYKQPSQAPVVAPTPVPAVPAPPPTIPQNAPLPPAQAVPTGGYRTDDASVTLATRHAKFAMSALNFDDVNTAVKELRLALQTLGAQ